MVRTCGKGVSPYRPYKQLPALGVCFVAHACVFPIEMDRLVYRIRSIHEDEGTSTAVCTGKNTNYSTLSSHPSKTLQSVAWSHGHVHKDQQIKLGCVK